jgi:hypothetical protein
VASIRRDHDADRFSFDVSHAAVDMSLAGAARVMPARVANEVGQPTAHLLGLLALPLLGSMNLVDANVSSRRSP